MAVAVGEAVSFSYKSQAELAKAATASAFPYILARRNTADTAANPTARERLVYGYMRSLRK
jgi:hypothetical protein